MENLPLKLTVCFLIVFLILGMFPFQLLPSVEAISGGSRIFAAYRSSTLGNQQTPKKRDWVPSTETWSSETALTTTGSNIRFVRSAACPIRQERVVMALCDDAYVDVYVYNTSGWFTFNNWFGVSGNSYGWRSFDLAYESNSGDLLVVFATGNTTQEIGYKTYKPNGGWTAKQLVELNYTTNYVCWIRLVRNPLTSSNEISMMYVDVNDDIMGCRWTGTTLADLGTAVWDATGPATGYNYQGFDIAYETSSGHAMFVWADAISDWFTYRHWDGSTLGASTNMSQLSAATQRGAWVELASHPSNDGILLAELDIASDLFTGYWNGASWSWTNGGSAHDTSTAAYQRKPFDFEWESDGTDALLCWDAGTGQTGEIHWKKFTPTTTWGGENENVMGGAANYHGYINLDKNPYTNVAGDVSILGGTIESTANDIGTFKWNGTTFTVIGASTLTANCLTNLYECYDINFIYNIPPTCVEYGKTTEIIGYTCIFYTFWAGVQLSQARFGWNETGNWVNETWTDPWIGTPSTGYFNISKTLPTTIKNIGWRVWANDSNYQGSISLQTFTTQNTVYGYEDIQLNSFSFNESKPNHFVDIATSLEFRPATANWVNRSMSTTNEYARWLKIYNIYTEDIFNYMEAYELNVYNGTWFKPSSVYNSSGYTVGHPPEHFIDNSTATRWEQQADQGTYYIIFDLNIMTQISQVSIYSGVNNAANWTNVKVAAGKATGWANFGNFSWINSTDAGSYISSNKADRSFGEINFTTTRMSILSSWIVANLSIASASSKLRIEFVNGTITRHVNITVTSASTWQVRNATLSLSYWNPCKRTFTLKSYDTNLIKIDHLYIRIKFVNITSVSKIIPHASYGITATQGEGNVANALFYHYLDQTDIKFKIIAFDTINLEWTEIITVGNSPSSDGHYAPSLAILPNRSLIIIEAYSSDVYYKISNYTLDNQANITELISNWKPSNNLTLSSWYSYHTISTYSYPTGISCLDRLLIFCRLGAAGGGTWVQLTFMNDAWTEKTLVTLGEYTNPYAEVTKIDSRIYLTYNKYNGSISGNYRVNVYLIVSDDYGETWQHWNGTTLTTPIGEQPLILEQDPTVYSYAVWNDENNKTNILYQWNADPPYGSLENRKSYIRILQANCTIPNPNAVWTNMSAMDENNQTLMGNTYAAYLDEDLSFSTIWVNPDFWGRQEYVAKYVRINGTASNYRQYFTYTDYTIVRYFARAITDYSIPYEAYSYAWEKDIMGLENTCITQTNSTAGMWLFKFQAQRSLNMSHIAIRVNITDDYKQGQYYGVIYDNGLNKIGSTGLALQGTQGAPPRESWDFLPLTQEVPIVKGNTYWIGFYNMSGAFKYFYNTTTSGNGALFTTQQGSWTVTSYTLYNRTASIYAVKAETIIWGLWDKLEFLTVGANYTCLRGGKEYNVKFWGKVVDYRGLYGTILYENETTGVSFTAHLTNSSGESSLWSNWTLAINISQGSRLAWYYWANNTLGDTEQTETFYIYTQFKYYGNASLAFESSGDKGFETQQQGIANLKIEGNGEKQADFTLNPSATLTLTETILNAFQFMLNPTATLTFTANAISSLVLNVFGSAILNIMGAFTNAFSFSINPSAILNLASEGSISYWTIGTLLHLWGTATLAISEAYTKSFQFTINPTAILNLSPQSLVQIISTSLLRLWGTATLAISETFAKSFSFQLYPTATLQLSSNGLVNFIMNLQASALLTLTENFVETFHFLLNPSAILTFTTSSLATFTTPFLYLYGTATLGIQAIASATGLQGIYATHGYVLSIFLGAILLVCIVVIPIFLIVLRRKR